MEFIGYVAAIFMGLSLGLLGGGGSILTVPILVYFFGLDALSATTGSLFVVGMTALLGAILAARRGLVDLKTGFLFALPSFAGVYLVRHHLLPAIPAEIPVFSSFTLSKSLLILGGFALLMVFASVAMIRPSEPRVSTEMPRIGIAKTAMKGFFIGGTTGFVGAGGGFLIIPALVLLVGLPVRRAIATSLAIIAANSLFGFALSASDSSMRWDLLAAVTLLGLAGLMAGQRLSPRVNEAKLKVGFGYFILTVGVLVLTDQLRR